MKEKLRVYGNRRQRVLKHENICVPYRLRRYALPNSVRLVDALPTFVHLVEAGDHEVEFVPLDVDVLLAEADLRRRLGERVRVGAPQRVLVALLNERPLLVEILLDESTAYLHLSRFSCMKMQGITFVEILLYENAAHFIGSGMNLQRITFVEIVLQ